MLMRHDPIDPGGTGTGELPVTPPAGLWVGDRMTCPAVTVTWAAPIASAVRLMEAGHVHHLPVVDAEQHLLGLVTADQVREALAAEGIADPAAAPPTLVIGRVMAWDALCVPPCCPLTDAADLMHEHKVTALPVVQGGRVVGILTERDLPPRPERSPSCA